MLNQIIEDDIQNTVIEISGVSEKRIKDLETLLKQTGINDLKANSLNYFDEDDSELRNTLEHLQQRSLVQRAQRLRCSIAEEDVGCRLSLLQLFT